MTIQATDLKLRASERMGDDSSTVLGQGGGGRMGTAVISGAVENDVFPDVAPGDRTTGATRFRKVYLQVMSDENDALENGAVALTARPSDVNCRVLLMKADGDDLQYQALVRSRVADFATDTSWEVFSAPAANQFTLVGTVAPPVGSLVCICADNIFPESVVSPATLAYRTISAVSGMTITYSGTDMSAQFAVLNVRTLKRNPASGAPGVAAPAVLTAQAASGQPVITVDRLREKFDQTSSTYGISGEYPVVYAGELVLVQHGSTPGTRELCTVLSVNHHANTITLTANLTNTYPTGSVVTRLLPVGSPLQASLTLQRFSQQTWLRQWTDSPSTPIAASYSGTIALVNAGAVTERWAVVFTSTTAFELYGERLGLIATGTTGANFIPVNPATNQPYFTMPSSGWGAGWLPGNTVRFNTRAAAAPFWAVRTVLAGSAAGGTVNAQLTLTGDANA